MCSISGIFSIGRDSQLRDAVQRMNAAQSHRGPDDHGVSHCEFPKGEILLGNTRLAIIDTSTAGHQPMKDPANGNLLTYNGETYNFKDLRGELGAPWISDTDTEVVLRAYRHWGVDAFGKLRGMFALAVWDHQKQHLLLARDALGIKPLYYYVDDNRVIFASELRALLASGLAPRQLSTAGVDSFLANGSVAAPLTIIAGVKQLLPGHCLQVRADESGQVELCMHAFAGRRSVAERPSDRSAAVAQLRAELEESVRLHLVSDVPLGVFLSGGMDSSALVALMSRIGNRRPKTFSVVFAESEFSEGQFSRAVAERFNTDHSEIRLSEDRLLEILPAAIGAIDQPTMDGINTFVVSGAVKQAGVTVALSGLGGDELFGGYPSFRRALRMASLSATSRRVLRTATGMGKFALPGSTRYEKAFQFADSKGSPQDIYRISRQLFGAAAAAVLTGRAGNHHENGYEPEPDVVNAISRLELQGYMSNTLLRDTDAMSMAHSLEVRVPFVDTKVVDYVLSLPGEWKLGDGAAAPKAMLSDALADLLPRDFLNRPKMGFTLPFEKWLQQNLRAEVTSVLADAQRLASAGLKADAAGKLWQTFLQRPRAVGWSRPWSLYILTKWCEMNRVTC